MSIVSVKLACHAYGKYHYTFSRCKLLVRRYNAHCHWHASNNRSMMKPNVRLRQAHSHAWHTGLRK
eukprot:6212814-Pleurochrysis_carterae.AAC.1